MGPDGRPVERGIRRLLGYIGRHGDARVPQHYMYDGYRLGVWVIVQREKHAKGTLNAIANADSKTARLVMGPSSPPGWEEGFRRLLRSSNATVTPASRCATRSMATSSVHGLERATQLPPPRHP